MTRGKQKRPRILCVHQGGELYGSDRSFLQAVQAMRESWPNANIKVVLAGDGPLRPLLKVIADEVQVRDLCVMRLANLVLTLLKCTIGLPWYVMLAVRDFARSDLVYINTTVIACYMIAARLTPAKAVIHAREIPKPKAMRLVRGFVKGSRARIIYNSNATMKAFALSESRLQEVLHNACDPIIAPQAPECINYCSERPLKVAMLGRINDWKGQDLLIDSVAVLSASERSMLRVRIVGSTFRDVLGPIKSLENQISKANLKDVISLEPFKDDPSEVYRWADICVVPSRMPEPFGRVAIEAMAFARPVLAARHGGLVEIVEDGKSGWLFEPNNAAALAHCLKEAIFENGLVHYRGIQALQSFDAKFSSVTMRKRLIEILKLWIPLLSR